jgi:hypothetical protein
MFINVVKIHHSLLKLLVAYLLPLYERAGRKIHFGDYFTHRPIQAYIIDISEAFGLLQVRMPFYMQSIECQ